MTEMDIITALAVLEDAIRHCMPDNVNMAGVLETLGFLQATVITRPFERFQKSLAPRDGQLELESRDKKAI